MGNGLYISILIIGVVIVLVDGQLILRTSPGYLGGVYDNPKRARQVAGLVTVLFHLVMLGVVALVASLALSPDAGIRSVLARVGVILILTAVGHGVTMAVLSRLRQQQLDTEFVETQIDHHRNPGQTPGGEPPADRPAI
jgi:hypothetical protein